MGDLDDPAQWARRTAISMRRWRWRWPAGRLFTRRFVLPRKYSKVWRVAIGQFVVANWPIRSLVRLSTSTSRKREGDELGAHAGAGGRVGDAQIKRADASRVGWNLQSPKTSPASPSASGGAVSRPVTRCVFLFSSCIFFLLFLADGTTGSRPLCHSARFFFCSVIAVMISSAAKRAGAAVRPGGRPGAVEAGVKMYAIGLLAAATAHSVAHTLLTCALVGSDPVYVLVFAVVFVFLIFALHIWGRFTRG